MPALTIAKLASEGGVGVETVRYYQRRGLMPEPERPNGASANGRVRRYGAEDVRRLRFIRAAQSAGFTLEEIGQLLSLDATETAPARENWRVPGSVRSMRRSANCNPLGTRSAGWRRSASRAPRGFARS